MTRIARASLAIIALLCLAVEVSAASINDAIPTRRKADSRPLFVVRQLFEAEIGKLDAKTGLVVVNTPSGKLKLVSPALSTTSLTKGDSVLVEVGILPAKPAYHARNERDAAVVRQPLQATVTAINMARGLLRLQTPAGNLDLSLPSNLLEQFKKAETLPVEVAVIPQPPATAAERANRTGVAAILLGIFGKK